MVMHAVLLNPTACTVKCAVLQSHAIINEIQTFQGKDTFGRIAYIQYNNTVTVIMQQSLM